MPISTGSKDTPTGGIAWVEFDGLSVAEITVTENENGDLIVVCEPSDGFTKAAEGFIAAEDR